MDSYHLPGGGVLPPSPYLPGTGPANLVVAAAAQCGMVGDTGSVYKTANADSTYAELVQQFNNSQTITSQTALSTPWTPTVSTDVPWYIFENKPTSCDKVLEYEETLLCIADKLAQLADAIAPVTWENVKFINAFNADSWIVPPQSDQDKFIARDTAMQVLAHIPWLDSFPFESSAPQWPGHTCSALYAGYDRGGLPAATVAALQTALFEPGSTHYPPDPAPGSGRTPARARLAFETNTLRAAGQLLHDLVRESVYADLAGAAHRSASAADQKGGQRSAWGLDGTEPYNSLGHTARVLLGRWEMGDGEPDPLCQGVGELDLLTLADSGTLARVADTSPTSAKEARAAAFFENAGIVIADGATTDARAVLQTQLMGMRAVTLGVTPADYALSPSGQALTTLIASVSDADLARGAQRTRTTFGLLTSARTNDPAQLLAAATRVGLSASTVSNPALGAGGLAIGNGLSRGSVATDVMARAGTMMVASQCPEEMGLGVLSMDENAAGALRNPQYPAYWSTAGRTIRQDVFAVGHALRTRLVKLREQADASAVVAQGTPPDARARAAAIAEIGAWAGSSRAVLSTSFGDSSLPEAQAPTSVYVDLAGVDPADFGVKTAAELGTVVSLVFGDASIAECAANLAATSCDPAAMARATWKAASTTIVTDVGSADSRANFGVTKSAVRLTFNVDASSPADLRLAGNFALAVQRSPFFLISSQDVTRARGVGAVLGALRLPVRGFGGGLRLTNYGGSAIVLSPMRRELLDAALGIGKWVGAAPPHAGENAFSMSPQYCVDGVPRDVFVPLENDLTSDADAYENSWRHYVSLARDAAKRADDIGQTWVDIGFRRDVEAERSGEQLQQFTGEASNTDEVKVDEQGNLTAGASNGALNAVLNQPTLDIVFFTTDPLLGVNSPADRVNRMKEILLCGANPTRPLCIKLQTPQTTLQFVGPNDLATFQGKTSDAVITYGALGFEEPQDPNSKAGTQKLAVCQPFVDSAIAMKGLNGNFSKDTFGSGMATWSADADLTAGAMNQLRMRVDHIGQWSVTLAGAALMDSDDAKVWPACLRSGNTCDWANGLTQSANAMFRVCSNVPAYRSALGSTDCEGGGSVEAELNMLRWRVQGVIWLAAAMSGGVPEGMFTTPMPAVDFPSADAQFGAPINTVFANGKFQTSNNQVSLLGGFGPVLNGEDVPLGELQTPEPIDQVDPVSQKPSRFKLWGPSVADVLPRWLREVYKPSTVASPGVYGGSGYVHVFGKNPSGPSDFSNLREFFDRRLGFAGLDASRITPRVWSYIANPLHNKSCASPTELAADLSVGNLPSGWMQGLVAAMKTQQAPSRGMRSSYFHGDDAFWGLWGTTYRWSGTAFEYQAAPGVPGVDRSQWFDQVPVRYHWYDSAFAGGTTQYSTDYFSPVANGGANAFSRDERLPSHVPPSARVRHALNSGAPNGDCGAAWEFTQAAALTCMVGSGGLLASLPPPSAAPTNLKSIDDLVQLEAWLRGEMKNASLSFQHAFVEAIPAAAVQNIVSPSSSSGGAGAEYGKHLLTVSNALAEVAKQWNLIKLDGAIVTDDIQGARIAIQQINVDAHRTQQQTLISKLGTSKDVALQLASAANGVAAFFGSDEIAQKVGGLATAGGAAAAIVFDAEVLDALGNITQDNGKDTALRIDAALKELDKSMARTSTDLSNALVTIRQDITSIHEGELALSADRSKAAYYAGKAAGLGVWACGTANHPNECTSHVNTVLNRQYSGQQRRYKSALRDAKALAYLARRAIEQRIGIRLSDIATRVGPLDPPSVWADDVCRLTGVDYRRLRKEPDLDAGTKTQRDQVNASLAAEFADGFIGDYVEKLATFVEFYNVAFPQKDADDSTVLSLRENVLRGSNACSLPSPNRLVDSSRMYATVPASNAQSVNGWQRHKCTNQTTCLQVLSLGAAPLPTDAAQGGVSWLVEQPHPPLQLGVDVINDGALDAPNGLISQTVALQPGTYALSWWDQARDAGGKIAAASRPYPAGIYDSNWAPVASWTGAPADGTIGWSARHSMTAVIAAPGTYHVVFGASLSGADGGSVAIANVQLEPLAAGAKPLPYADTDSSGRVSSFMCAATAGDLRASFRRMCEPDGTCFYELTTPISLDTKTLRANGVPLKGKLAAGNFNFRHIDVALNLAGTAVRDCTGTSSPDCYGSGYLEYTLAHDGNNVGVLGFDGEARSFDFGVGSIEHGKALTAERYITTPVSSGDQQLLAPLMKTELRGRPLDGIYRLRIYDTAALHWDRLEDVQIVLKYHYWSRIATPGQF
jgi:hypothetical protein